MKTTKIVSVIGSCMQNSIAMTCISENELQIQKLLYLLCNLEQENSISQWKTAVQEQCL